jgi:hypothetical protein
MLVKTKRKQVCTADQYLQQDLYCDFGAYIQLCVIYRFL